MVVKFFSDATCLWLQNNQHGFTHPFFFFHFFPTVSFIHNSSKINSLLFQMMLPNLTHQQRRPGAKICSILPSFCVRLQASCHSREQPGFLWKIYQKLQHQKRHVLVTWYIQQTTSLHTQRRAGHTCSCILRGVAEWFVMMLKAEFRTLQHAREKVSTKLHWFNKQMLRRGVDRTTGAWGLCCSVLDMELQAQPQTWVLSEEMRQGMCEGTGEWEEWEHL